jgi:hypothetical protein
MHGETNIKVVQLVWLSYIGGGGGGSSSSSSSSNCII